MHNYDLLILSETWLKLQNQFTLKNFNIIRKDRLTLEKGSDSINANNNPIILGGDFNSHHTAWGCNNDCLSGSNVVDFSFQNNLIILNDGSPTRNVNFDENKSAIYLTLVSDSIATLCSWKVAEDAMGSDHYPILLSINVNPEHNTFKHRFNLKNINWDDFQDHLENKEEMSSNLPDAIATYDKLNSTITQAIESQNLPKGQSNNQQQNNNKPTKSKPRKHTPAP
ncbi:GSCOCG00011987001-RA-CDS [Cotesia congregata]|nr:GSCOCG00011987001-RA-CDS [Cotesia congregata]